MTTTPETSHLGRVSLRPAASFGVGFFALCVAWMSVLPLFAGPDEPANFIKSAAVVRGAWVGEPIAVSATTSFWSTYVDIDPQFGTAQQVPWCFVGQRDTPACDKPLTELSPVEASRTDMGRYPPLGFLPAGVGTLVGASDLGVRAARGSAAVVSCALLALAAELLRRRGRSITPLLVAVSPGALFLSSVQSPSGLEIAAAIAAWVAAWVAVAEQWRVKSTVAVFVMAACLLVVARPAGLVTVGVMLAAALVANDRAVVAGALASWRRCVWLGVAVVASGAWYLGVYDANFGVQLDIESRMSKFSTIASRSIADLPRLVGESVGNFGWLDTPSPTFVVWGFVATTAAVAWTAVGASTIRVKLAIALTIAAVPVWHIALNVNYQDLLGSYGAQGRHLTPFLVGIPLAATVHRLAQRSDRVAVTLFVVAHAWCVLVALRRYSLGAGGDDLLGFVRGPAWSPPLGMGLTLAVVAVAHVAAWFALCSPTGGFRRSPAGRMER